MSINKRQYQLLQGIVKSRAKTVYATDAWKAIHFEYGLGILIQGKLRFTVKDIDKMREVVMNNLSMDPLYIDAEGDRVSLAGITHNEKLSGGQVFSSNVHVARGGNLPIMTPGGETFTPGKTALTIMDGKIDLSHNNSVVLIENGAVFANWSSLELPKECSGALILYRGHGSGVKTTYEILKGRPASCSLFGFFDFDPAGLAMAVDTGCDGVILPDNIDVLLCIEKIQKLNKTEHFHKQWSKNASYIESNMPSTLSSVVEQMKRHEVALTQEMLVSLKIPLRLY